MNEMQAAPSRDRTNRNATNVVAACGVLATWVIVAVRWSAGPSRIPVHFNLHGQVDRYGARSTLLLMPLIATAVFALLAILQQFPQIYNLPMAKGTPQRAEGERLGEQMLSRITLLLCWFFALLEAAFAYALPPSVLLPLSLLVTASLLAVVIVSLVRMQRLT